MAVANRRWRIPPVGRWLGMVAEQTAGRGEPVACSEKQFAHPVALADCR